MTVTAPGARTRLVVLDTETLAAKVVASPSDADVAGFDWANDNRLVFTLRDSQTAQGDSSYGPGLFAVSREGGDFVTLVERSANQPAYLSGLPSGWRLLRTSRGRNSNDIFVAAARYDNKGNFLAVNVRRQDTLTGRTTSLNRPGDTVAWLFDTANEPRVTMTREGNVMNLLYNDTATGAWRTLKKFDAFGDDGIWPVALDGDGTLYVRAQAGRDTTALYRYDFKANAIEAEPVVSVPGYDLDSSLILKDGKLVGMRYQSDAPGTFWLDDAHKKLQKRIDDLLPGTVNMVSIGEGPEAGAVLIYAFSDVDPGRYLLFNAGTGKMTPLGQRMAGIDARQMAPKDMVRYKARDGLDIPAYLTLPKGTVKKNLPLVVLVHGSPWDRGGPWNWNAQTQFLASRGYAVLEPEFRGTSGFGAKHFRAGWKQWGLAMQDDLADGARWAIAQGIADPGRICVIGDTYGGYAAMMGLVRDSDLFRCGISWMGPTDIDLMYSIFWSGFSEMQKTYTMPVLIGDREADAAQFKATSPLLQAGRIKQPVLLAYGGADRVVPIEHGIKLRDALRQAGNPPEWIEYTEEGHGWTLVKNRVDFWTRVEKFLERNIGAR